MFGCRKSSDIFTGLRRDFAVHAEVFARALVSRARAYIDEKGGCEIGCEKSSDQRTPLWGRCWAAAIWRSNPFPGSHASSCVGCQALSDVPYCILYELLSSGFYIAVYCWVGAQHCAIRVFKSVLSPQESWIHPWSLAWNLKMTPVEKEIPFGNYHFKFYLEIWACIRMILLFVWWGTRPTHASLRQTVAVLQACRDVLCGQRWWFKQIDMFEDGVGFITGNRIFKGFYVACNLLQPSNITVFRYLIMIYDFMIFYVSMSWKGFVCVCVSSRFRLY